MNLQRFIAAILMVLLFTAVACNNDDDDINNALPSIILKTQSGFIFSDTTLNNGSPATIGVDAFGGRGKQVRTIKVLLDGQVIETKNIENSNQGELVYNFNVPQANGLYEYGVEVADATITLDTSIFITVQPFAANELQGTWQVSQVTENGLTQAIEFFNGLSISFTANANGTPAGYTITQGSAPYAPNFGSSTSGTFNLDDLLRPGNLELLSNTGNSSLQVNIDFGSTPPAITLTWALPETADKTQPIISMTFTKA